ncbi:unnamed protein product [Rotaria sordida]|uniref:Major facilitator superfamily (MFS) profile domain-containing protein n=1 Tax=Rotaria sordida TaxID=392033 RepID=A0A815GHY6_9BILA|nr:unnamed protein product [Rotaria sordida]CAF1338669.1 unnamed protein product [Rotaria sordida]
MRELEEEFERIQLRRRQSQMSLEQEFVILLAEFNERKAAIGSIHENNVSLQFEINTYRRLLEGVSTVTITKTREIALIWSNSSTADFSAIDSKASSVLQWAESVKIMGATISLPTAFIGPKGCSGVLFSAVYYTSNERIIVGASISDQFNFYNYGQYQVTIFYPNSKTVIGTWAIHIEPKGEICMPKQYIIRDSINNIIADATVEFLLKGQVIFTGTSDKAGIVNLPRNLSDNCYDVMINTHKAQYKTVKFQRIVFQNRGAESVTYYIYRQMQSDEVEFLLTWGKQPSDLDSHIRTSVNKGTQMLEDNNCNDITKINNSTKKNVILVGLEPMGIENQVNSGIVNELDDKKILRKLDLHLIPTMTLLYLLSFLDRVNIGQAKLNGLTISLKLSSIEYNICLSVFFITYAVCEIPSNLILKKCRPSRWIPFTMIAWGTVVTFMGLVNSYQSLLVCRLLLGATESGLFPGATFYLSSWYKRRELSWRVSILFSGASLAGAFGGVLAYGINKMDGLGKQEGWRWIFYIEGMITVIVGALAFFLINDFPTDRPKFLSEQECNHVLVRLRTDAGPGASEHFSWIQVYSAFSDWKIYIWSLCLLGISVPIFSLSLFSPSIVLSLGFVTYQAQLLTTPPYAFAFITTMTTAYFSDKYAHRSMFILLCPHTKRATALAFMLSVGIIGGVISGQLYRSQDAPHFILGHAINLGFCTLSLIALTIILIGLHMENRRRDRLYGSIGSPTMQSVINKDQMTTDVFGIEILCNFYFTVNTTDLYWNCFSSFHIFSRTD